MWIRRRERERRMHNHLWVEFKENVCSFHTAPNSDQREREREDRFSLRRLRWSDLLSAEQIFGLFVSVLFYFTWSISSVLTCLVSIFMSESLLNAAKADTGCLFPQKTTEKFCTLIVQSSLMEETLSYGTLVRFRVETWNFLKSWCFCLMMHIIF